MAKKEGKKANQQNTAEIEAALEAMTLPLTAIGERRNYNLQQGVTEYRHWPFSTIEWVAEERRYRARAMLQHVPTRDLVAIRSSHAAVMDAERAIDLVRDAMQGSGERRLINVFGEVVEIRSADIGGGPRVQGVEVQGLIWTMQNLPTS